MTFLSGGSVANALLSGTTSSIGSSSTNATYPGGSIAYYNYLAKSGDKLLQQSNNSRQIQADIAYFKSRIAQTVPAKATSLIRISGTLSAADAVNTTRSIQTKIYDANGNAFTATVTFRSLGPSGGNNSYIAQLSSIAADPNNPDKSLKATVQQNIEILTFNGGTGSLQTTTQAGHATNNLNLGLIQLSDGTTLKPKFSFSGGGTTGGNLTESGGVFLISAVQQDGQLPVTGSQNIKSVDDLFKDQRLLNFILTATGLGDQEKNVGLVKKALTEDPAKASAIVNKLSNKKFLQADKDLQLYDGLSNLRNPTTIQNLITSYQKNTFEQGIAKTDTAVAQARYFASNIGTAVSSASTTTNAAYAILGDSVLRDVVTTALGFPKQLAVLPVKDQAALINERVNVNQFKDPKFVASFVTRYLTQVQNSQTLGTSSTGGIALSMLQGVSTR